MHRPDRRSLPLISLVTLVGFLIVLGGCGSLPSTDKSPKSSTPSTNEFDLKPVLQPLELARENYHQALSGGAVVNQDRYQKSLLYSRKARDAWLDTRGSLERTSTPDRLQRLDQSMRSLVSLVENQKSPRKISQLVGTIRTQLESLPTQNVPPERRGTVRSVRRADRDIQAETQTQDIRVGAALMPSRSLYRGSDTVSRAGNNTHQLRVWLREVRTKRALPGARVTAQFLNAGDTVLEEYKLLETWGPYLFYGQNLTVPEATQRLRLMVYPSTVGRHGDMKDLLTEPFTLGYSIASGPDTVAVLGPDPEPAAEDYTLGSDVQMALHEALSINTVEGYRIGFVAEHSEPFWVHRADPGRFSLADIPRNANRHLEIVLFTADSYRIVPHADVSLTLRRAGSDDRLRTPLPFLLSAFHHYGNSVYLPAGSYSISATVGRPDLHTLKPDRFPRRVTTQFDWDAEPVEPGSSEDHHE